MDNYILLISKKTVSLLTLHNNQIDEIRDGVFPMIYKDDYEYARTYRGNSFGYSLKSFEKDKSISKKERFSRFLAEVNKNLKSYLNRNNEGLFIAGTDQDRSSFKRVFDYNHLIQHELTGSFSAKRLSQVKQAITDILTV